MLWRKLSTKCISDKKIFKNMYSKHQRLIITMVIRLILIWNTNRIWDCFPQFYYKITLMPCYCRNVLDTRFSSMCSSRSVLSVCKSIPLVTIYIRTQMILLCKLWENIESIFALWALCVTADLIVRNSSNVKTLPIHNIQNGNPLSKINFCSCTAKQHTPFVVFQ